VIVDDLRAFSRDPKGRPNAAAELCRDAADTIERLIGEVVELKREQRSKEGGK